MAVTSGQSGATSVALVALVRHRDKQGAEWLGAGDGYRDQGFVFADERGNPPPVGLLASG
jgi:hypothetical protein